MLKGLERVGADRVQLHVDLHAAAGVLQGAEGGLAHHALEHHAAGDAGRNRARFEVLGAGMAVRSVQRGDLMLRAEVVGKGRAGLTQAGELGAPLGDDLVLVELGFVGCGRGGRGLVGHRVGRVSRSLAGPRGSCGTRDCKAGGCGQPKSLRARPNTQRRQSVPCAVSSSMIPAAAS